MLNCPAGFSMNQHGYSAGLPGVSPHQPVPPLDPHAAAAVAYVQSLLPPPLPPPPVAGIGGMLHSMLPGDPFAQEPGAAHLPVQPKHWPSPGQPWASGPRGQPSGSPHAFMSPSSWGPEGPPAAAAAGVSAAGAGAVSCEVGGGRKPGCAVGGDRKPGAEAVIAGHPLRSWPQLGHVPSKAEQQEWQDQQQLAPPLLIRAQVPAQQHYAQQWDPMRTLGQAHRLQQPACWQQQPDQQWSWPPMYHQQQHHHPRDQWQQSDEQVQAAYQSGPSNSSSATRTGSGTAGAGGVGDVAEVQQLLSCVQSRMMQVAPDWPCELQLAAVEALLLDLQFKQQQQQQQPHKQPLQPLQQQQQKLESESSCAALMSRLGNRVPISASVLSHAAKQLPDRSFVSAARQLQEELQAAWVSGMRLPHLGGNPLLPSRPSGASPAATTSTATNSLSATQNVFGYQPPPGNPSAASSWWLPRLPAASAVSLSLALFEAWGAAPKISRLISTPAAGNRSQPAAAEASGREGSWRLKPAAYPLPPVVLSWAASGGVVSSVVVALQQAASEACLADTAADMLAVLPPTGIDFGTNQVAVIPCDDMAAGEQEQSSSATASISISNPSSSSSSSSGRVPGAPVVRQLRIVNTHKSRDVLLLNVCLAPEYVQWVTLSAPHAGITGNPGQLSKAAQQHTELLHSQQQQQESHSSAGASPSAVARKPPAGVLLQPGSCYSVDVVLNTSTTRQHSQIELGVISQVCLVTAATAADTKSAAAAVAEAVQPAHLTADSATDDVGVRNARGTHGRSSDGKLLPAAAPPGWDVFVCGVPVAGGLVSHLSALKSVLRVEAKPFISAALRRLFLTAPPAGSCVAFIPACRTLSWDVPMDKWHLYNGLDFLDPQHQPGLVPAAQVARLTSRRFKAMMQSHDLTTNISTANTWQSQGQPPLLTWGPPVLQLWQRLLLLEEGACERDMTAYSVYNARLETAVFSPDSSSSSQRGGGRRYAIASCLDEWPLEGPPDDCMYTYCGPHLPVLLGAARAVLGSNLAVINVPGLSENRPGLVTGDVVYLRLASPISTEARGVVLQALEHCLQQEQQKAARVQRKLAANPSMKYRPAQHGARDLNVAALQVLCDQLQSSGPWGPLEVEAAGHVAAVDGSKCLLVMPDAFWLLLRELASYDQRKGDACKGGWGLLHAAASPLLVHACFCFDRTGHGRMQALLPRLAGSPRLLLPPDLLAGAPGSGVTSAGGGRQASSVAGAAETWALLASELVAVAGLAPGDKHEEVLSLASSLSMCGGVPLNLQQRLAVASILAGGGVAAPYVLFGPPGTGKSVTVVETVLQYRRANPGAHVLCCAPANYSADLLCSALARAGVGVEDMLRLNDPRRPPAQAKPDTLPYCVLNETLGSFSLEQGLLLAQHRPIVVCSTITAGLLLANTCKPAAIPIRPPGAPQLTAGSSAWQDQPQLHQCQLSGAARFDLVVVDEAGQGLASEVLLPLSLARPQAPIMLAGDPRQLGPVLRSATAAAVGLGVSLLDSWISFWHSGCPELAAAQQQQQVQQGARQGQVQQQDVAAAPLVALCYGMLVDNYRSHSRLLDLPSRLFYGGALRACAPPAAVAPPPWSEIMVPTAADAAAHPSDTAADDAGEGAVDDGLGALCPSNTLFVGVNGQQRQDGDAPSYYNPQEVLVLAELLVSLLGTPAASGSCGAPQRAAVSVNDVGVIATYRRQVQKIRLLLRERGLGAVRVGTVDDYQGQEERIIFISTTLSKPESLPPPLPDMSTVQQEQDGLDGRPCTAFAGGISDVGFWRNPKRFNVAITRAKALLVVVGSPRVLAADNNWRQLLQHCVARGAYRGAGSSYLCTLLRIGAMPEGGNANTYQLAVSANAPMVLDAATDRGREQPGKQQGPTHGSATSSCLEGLLADDGDDDDDANLALAVQAIAEAAQLGMGHVDMLYPQTLDEYYAACEEEQPWKVAL